MDNTEENISASWIIGAKHWQLFLALFLPYELIGILFGPSLFMVKVINVTFFLLFVGSLFWIGFSLRKYTKHHQSAVPATVACLVLFLLLIYTATTYGSVDEPDPKFPFGLHSVITLLSFGCMATISGFPASVLKSIELNEEVDINDYYMDLLLFLFWPFGIWFLQPRINKIAGQNSSNQ